MGYEIAGGLGVKLAAPEREVYVLVGDGSYLMLSSEIVTSIQEGLKLTIVLVDNHGFNSIGGLSRSLGTDGFGTLYRYRRTARSASTARSRPTTCRSTSRRTPSRSARTSSARRRSTSCAPRSRRRRRSSGPTVIAIEVDRYEGVPGYESWWDVPVAEVSEVASVRAAREHTRRRARTSGATCDRRGGDGTGRDRPLPERARDPARRGAHVHALRRRLRRQRRDRARAARRACRDRLARRRRRARRVRPRLARRRGRRRPLPRHRPVLADAADVLRGLAAGPLPAHLLPPADRAGLAALARGLRRGGGRRGAAPLRDGHRPRAVAVAARRRSRRCARTAARRSSTSTGARRCGTTRRVPGARGRGGRGRGHRDRQRGGGRGRAGRRADARAQARRARRDGLRAAARRPTCPASRSTSSTASAPATRSRPRSGQRCCRASRSSRPCAAATVAGAIVASRLACSEAMPRLDEIEGALV